MRRHNYWTNSLEMWQNWRKQGNVWAYNFAHLQPVLKENDTKMFHVGHCRCVLSLSLSLSLSLRFNGTCSTATWVSRYHNVSFWILLELRMMKAVVTTGVITHAKVQSNHHHQQTNTQFLHTGCPSYCPTNSVRALKGRDTVGVHPHKNILY